MCHIRWCRCGTVQQKLITFPTVGVGVQVTDTDALEGAPDTFQLLDASDYWEVCSCSAERSAGLSGHGHAV